VIDGLRGRLIALEGIDGCGKSTQSATLASRLGALHTFEPGATSLGGSLRRLLLDADLPPVVERAEALMMSADRAQHVAEVVMPALDVGTWVVTDRFSGSTFAYQGHGRGMDLDELDRLVTWASGGLRPDLTVLIDIPVELAIERRTGECDDRFEGLGSLFQRKVADGFRRLAEANPDTWVVVDGTGSIEDVAESVWSVVCDRMGVGPAHD
jgi:dTMP kinase